MRVAAAADALGTIGSALCIMHCLASPIVLVTGALLPSVLLPDEQFHQAMLWFVVPTSAVAVALGCRRHKDRPTLLLGVAGVLGLLLAGTAPYAMLGELGEKVVTLLAAALLISGHARNFRLCRSEDCEHRSAVA